MLSTDMVPGQMALVRIYTSMRPLRGMYAWAIVWGPYAQYRTVYLFDSGKGFEWI